MKPKKINKLKGILCRSVGGKYFFRTYLSDGSFKDYQLAHSDLSIEIQDDEAYIYQQGDDLIIDHSPATLGLSDTE